MNYAVLRQSIMAKLLLAMGLINNPEIQPHIRQMNQEILFGEVGNAIYNKVYEMNAWDFGIEHTRGYGIDKQHFGLAKIVSGSISTGVNAETFVDTFIKTIIGQAQRDAFITAKESAKVPTVTRKVKGSKPCKWCIGLAGKYEDPDGDVFRRHGNCSCEIWTDGYKSRNGLLDNYVKAKK